MRVILGVFFIIIICFSCRSPNKEPKSIRDFLKDKFGYNMAAQDSVDSKSYLNDTSDTYIRSFIVLNSQLKFPTNDLKKNRFQEFQQNIDTIILNRYNTLTLRYPVNDIGDVRFPVPIDPVLAKNLLINKVKLKVHEYKLIFYDTLSNKFYFYRHEFYKPSIF